MMTEEQYQEIKVMDFDKFKDLPPKIIVEFKEHSDKKLSEVFKFISKLPKCDTTSDKRET